MPCNVAAVMMVASSVMTLIRSVFAGQLWVLSGINRENTPSDSTPGCSLTRDTISVEPCTGTRELDRQQMIRLLTGRSIERMYDP